MCYMRIILFFLIFPSFVFADQGINISCVNMTEMLDKKPKIHRYKFDVTTFQYFDEKKDLFIEVPNKNLIIKEDFFAARFEEHELGFQINVFSDKKKPLMTMSKYDYKNDKFLEHYYCDVKVANINEKNN